MINETEETYNGWANWDTWNANLWMTNDEFSYVCAGRCPNSDTLKQTYIDIFGMKHDDIDIDRVDWDEIFDGLNE